MTHIFLLLLLPLMAVQTGDAGAVRIGLFSLLKPAVLQVRLARGVSARLDAGGLSGGSTIVPGERVRILSAGARLNIVILDSYGRPKRTFSAQQARIIPAPPANLELILPGKIERVVHGEVSVAAQENNASGPLRIVLTTEREAAVASVVAAELSGQRAPEAFKALAVVVRTFMLSHAGRHSDEGFDFCDTTHCQLYRGESDLAAEGSSPLVASAVAQTASESLSFAGHPIEAYYTAVCGGATITPEMAWGGASLSGYPYQRIACRWCHLSRYNRWERRADAASVLDALSPVIKRRLSQAAQITVEKTESDLVRSVIIEDGSRQSRLSVDRFRRAIGRKLGWSTVLSPTFAIERRGRVFVFRGRGFGSQVGLCMAGAVAQAEAGRSYRDILSFYYPNTEIINRRPKIEARKSEITNIGFTKTVRAAEIPAAKNFVESFRSPRNDLSPAFAARFH